MSRTVSRTIVKGVFGLPLGVKFLNREAEPIRSVEVSTVCLDGGHLEDTLGICEPEHGYETMVFPEGCSFFSLFTEKYPDRRSAAKGHKAAVRNLLAGKLPLAIALSHYYAWEEVAAA